MSEDSDPDEFFDAEERTPVRTARTSALTSVSDEDDSVTVPITDLSHNIAEEEQKLLEAQRVAEERRRKEDEEIQQKLVELMKLKEKQKEAKEAEMRAKEAERRRRKLQDMRMNMSEDASSHQQQQRASDSNTDVEEQQPRTDSPEDNNSVGAVGTASLALASGDSCLGPSTSSDTSTSSNEEPHQTVSEPLPIIHVTEPDDQSVNFNSPDTEKFASKKMTMVLTKNVHSAPSVENDPACGATGGGVAATIKEEPGEEPDLIQSVKTSSLGRDTPAAPVAPPRRRGKHRGGAGTTRSSAGASIDMDSDADSIGELETPTSTVFNLTQELERSLCLSVPAPAASAVEEQSVHDLDMTLATRGKRLVTASEDASAKAEDLRSMTGSTTDNQSAGSSENDGAAAAMAARRLVRSTHAKCEQIDAEKARSMSAEEVFTVNVGTQGGEIPLSMLRPRTNSGSRYLSDCEILEQVTVLNLDTGEQVPLAHAEEKLPKCINPLSLHIMRRTKEYSSDSSLHKGLDEETPKTISTIGSPSPGNSSTEAASLSGSRAHIKKRGAKFKKLIGKTAKKIKLKADNVLHRDDDKNNSSDEEELGEGRSLIKIKAAHKHKGPYDFDLLVPVQDIIGAHVGAVWCMKFSPCGRLLASGGQDNLLRVWVLKDAFSYFDDMRTKYNEGTKVSPAPSQDSLNLNEAAATSHSHDPTNAPQTEHPAASDPAAAAADDDWFAPFRKRPLQVYSGHAADLLDISWSKNYFLLSASMDKTVRLWHVSRGECLCCFQHIDFVTSIAFHPKDDRYFLSGSLDGKLRLWSIPDKKVTLWNEVSGHTKLITAANFCLNGKFAVVGTYDGRCVFYSTEQLKYYTQIHVRSTRGKNSRGRKITGVEPFPGEDKLLVTSNDSRIRMYDLRDLSLTCKFKGCANNSSQIKAGFSHDGRYIVCGSEDHFVYIWRTQHEFYKFSSARRDRSDYWEGIKAHNAVVTTAIFSPHPRLIIKPQFEYVDADNKTLSPDDQGEVLISADYSGTIKVFINKFKPESMM